MGSNSSKVYKAMTLPFQTAIDAMIEAVTAGDQAECERLLAKDDALKNATDRNGDTALMFASFWGHLGIAAMLVDRGADMEAKNIDGDTALMGAINNGELDIADMLELKSAERAALLTSPDLAAAVWTSITSTLSAGPPPPFQLCPWPHFVSFFLPPAAAEALHARVARARTDAAACFTLLCIALRGGTGAEALRPVSSTLRDFLVHPEVTRHRMRDLEPVLKERARNNGRKNWRAWLGLGLLVLLVFATPATTAAAPKIIVSLSGFPPFVSGEGVPPPPEKMESHHLDSSTFNESEIIDARLLLWSSSSDSCSNPTVAANTVYEPGGEIYEYPFYGQVVLATPAQPVSPSCPGKDQEAVTDTPFYLYRHPNTGKWIFTRGFENVEKLNVDIEGTIMSVGTPQLTKNISEEGLVVFINGHWTKDTTRTLFALKIRS